MKGLGLSIYLFAFCIFANTAQSYTNLTPAEVHERLVNRDSLLLLDVREVYEYQDGHIAEPEGQLPLTPVNMPWSSGVLNNEFHRLPKDIDILVYCRSGGRSAAASSFLENQGFTRVFNMTGGFSSWQYESRNAGFGDHSGNWINENSARKVIEVRSITNGDTSFISLTSDIFATAESTYVELHYVPTPEAGPANIPNSDLSGLFRITAVDPFGLSCFTADSLVLKSSVRINLFPQYSNDSSEILKSKDVKIFIPDQGWKRAPFIFENGIFSIEEKILRRWYNLEGFITAGIKKVSQPITSEVLHAYPNPFNNSIKIITPSKAVIEIYDVTGKFIQQLNTPVWNPDLQLSSGIYIIRQMYKNQFLTKRITFLK